MFSGALKQCKTTGTNKVSKFRIGKQRTFTNKRDYFYCGIRNALATIRSSRSVILMFSRFPSTI